MPAFSAYPGMWCRSASCFVATMVLVRMAMCFVVGLRGVCSVVVQWCRSAVVQWCGGAVVLWCGGAVVQWHSGVVVQ